jgi:hypothetical protein
MSGGPQPSLTKDSKFFASMYSFFFSAQFTKNRFFVRPLRLSQPTQNIVVFLLYRSFSHCPELKTLTICDCPNVTENSIVQFIAKLKNLKTLNLWGCNNISAVSIQLFLRYFTNLSGLGLSHFTQLQDYSLKGLETSTELRVRLNRHHDQIIAYKDSTIFLCFLFFRVWNSKIALI